MPKIILGADTNSLDITKEVKRKKMSIEDLLIYATDIDCSDLYIKELDYPYVTRFGKIIRLPCMPISEDDWAVFQDRHILKQFLVDYAREKLYDTSIAVRIPTDNPNYGKYGDSFYRYRACFGWSEDKRIATFRPIRPEKRTFDNINFSKACEQALRIAYNKRTGITLLTGPTGCGKSTTLAACINTFTQTDDVLDNKVIITLEDPIENLFDSTDSVKITQKELGKDFKSYANGIKAALREHPTNIIVGEMRDREVICTAIEAGRTGHAVSSTFHASDVGGTLARILYHLDNDKNLTYDLVIQLNLIMAQRMLKRDDRYLVDTQYLLFNEQVTKTILNQISNPQVNVELAVNQILKDQRFLEAGLSKDWDYPDEV